MSRVTIRLGTARGDEKGQESITISDPHSLDRVRSGLIAARQFAFPDSGRDMTTPFGSVEVEFHGEVTLVFWLSTSGFCFDPEVVSPTTLFFAPELVDVLLDSAIEHGHISQEEMLAFRLLGSACR